ncbi:MAG: hypothetical protein AAGJ32_04110 [Pseudomonadota bacterium]
MIALLMMAGVALFLLIRGIWLHEKFMELPTLMAMLYISFLVPQALVVERDYGPLLNTWFAWTYMTACLIAILIGFEVAKAHAGRNPSSSAAMNERHYESRLMFGAVCLAVLGGLASARVGAIASSNNLGTEWTGVVTFWYLFMQALFFAFALCCLRYVKTRRFLYVLIGALVAAAIAAAVLQNVKRNMIAEIGIIVAGAMFFVLNVKPPRIVIIVGALLGTVLLHQVGSVRSYVDDGRGNALQAFVEGVPFEKFEYFEMERAPEVAQGVVDIQATNESGELIGLMPYWNRLVHQYVPAFLVGRDLKNALMVNQTVDMFEEFERAKLNSRGATRTGFADSYQAFSIFGVVVFLLLGGAMGWLYAHAINGKFWAQFYYLVLLNDSLIAVTESTARFIAGLPFLLFVTYFIVAPSAPTQNIMGRVRVWARRLGRAFWRRSKVAGAAHRWSRPVR